MERPIEPPRDAKAAAMEPDWKYWATHYKATAERMAGELVNCGDRIREQRAEINRLAALSIERPLEPVAEVVGFNKIGFGQLPIVAWNKPPSLGDKLYGRPVAVPVDGGDK